MQKNSQEVRSPFLINDVSFLPGPDGATISRPDGEGQRAGILILHGSEGGLSGWSSLWALKLAMRGFVSYPFSYSKGGDYLRAGDIQNVDLEKTCEALDWLRRYPSIK